MVEGVSCKLSFDLHVIPPPQHTKKYNNNDNDDPNKRILSSPLSSLAMSIGGWIARDRPGTRTGYRAGSGMGFLIWSSE